MCVGEVLFHPFPPLPHVSVTKFREVSKQSLTKGLP